jgi:hypothetical protein
MKKIMYALMLCVIVCAFASCGAEDLLSEKYIKFTLGGTSYSFTGNIASDSIGPVAIVTTLGSGSQLAIAASKEGSSATDNHISFIGTSSSSSWVGVTFTLEVAINGTIYGATEVPLNSLKVTGDLPIKVLTATFNNIDVVDSSDVLNTKKITNGKIEVKYGTSDLF